MTADSLAIFISSGGNLPELLTLQQKVSAQGAKVLAITANQSMLAKRADAALVAEHNEHAATHLPMVSRVLHLLLVDILVVGLEMHRAVGKAANDTSRTVGTPAALGVRMASPLRPAISHSQ
jgi:glucokinase